ncbi:OPT/YSL family transporter [Anaerococcus porci]|uniref:OPT/YSL family transporter n=1 Tax=Anaerococcus porci TaxID=2652269 RepID=UPI002A74AC93|nr:OPT/YSL family transporter [Anaerococcus porci]MDY3007269.1 OPT/YSL family transporter [Anaerococcus porci]
MKKQRISAFEPKVFILGIILSVFSAIICMQIIAKVGFTPNTSIIGAIVAMVLAKIPLQYLSGFKSLERQNLIQTTVSAAGFSSANCTFLACAIFFVLGKEEMIFPMAIGSAIGVVVSIVIVGKLYDTPVFPASAAWPPGVATADAIIAGDQGGDKGKRLLEGLIVGAVASHFGLPAAGIGIVFISNIFSMVALGVGLLIRGYSEQLFGFNLGNTYIPHGVMIGAGLMALIQSILIISKSDKKPKTENNENIKTTVSASQTKKVILVAIIVYLISSLALAAVSGIITNMGVSQLILWVLWTTFSAVVAMILVGMAAMHSGWFPAFAITTIFMTIGMFMGFEVVPLALLTGFVSSVGPCFADMGYDLKTGWILRGKSEDIEYELYGRKQQVIIEAVGGLIGVVVVALTMSVYFNQDLMPPVSRVFATTVQAQADTELIKTLLIWAIPGFIIQAISGSSRMVGVLFATGLLINNPVYGIGVILAVIVRLAIGTEFMETRDAGLIAGDGIYGFIAGLINSIF